MSLIFIIFFLGGLGSFFSIEIAGLIISGILFLTTLGLNKPFKIPKNAYLLIIFISLQFISLFWTKNILNSIEYIILFLASLGFWLFFYNSDDFYKKYLIRIIPVIGILFFLLFLFTNLTKLPFITKLIPENCCTLYSPYSENHNHLGDYWSIVILVLLNNLLNTNSLLRLVYLFTGFLILFISKSRSAVVGILIPLYFFLDKKITKEKKKYIDYLFIFLFLTLFIVSLNKVTIFSRPYYIQAIISLLKNPIGIGMGNFRYITSEIPGFIFTSSFAAKAHNIFFEVTSGLGVLSIPFFVFFIQSVRETIKNKKKQNSIFSLILLSLSINFFFNVTYAIPTMLWLWFSTLGIIQKDQEV